jgi:hypothetical protein
MREPLGAGRAARMERAANSVHVLCDALWEALHDQLGDERKGTVSADGDGPTAQRAAELSERVADVAATVALLARAPARATARRTPSMTPATRSEAAVAAPSGMTRPWRRERLPLRMSRPPPYS